MVLYFFTETTPRRFSKHPLPPPNRPTRQPPPPSPNHNPPPPRLHLSPSLPPPPLPLLRAEATTGQETADPGGKLLRSSSSGAGGAVAGPGLARRRTCGGGCRHSGAGERCAAPALARGSRRGRERLLQLGSWRAGGPDLVVLNLGPQRNSRSGWCARWQPPRGPRGGGRRSRRHASPWRRGRCAGNRRARVLRTSSPCRCLVASSEQYRLGRVVRRDREHASPLPFAYACYRHQDKCPVLPCLSAPHSYSRSKP